MKRILTMALAVLMLFGCIPVSAQAAATTVPQADGAPLGMDSIGFGGYEELTSSQELIDMIKVMEGFTAQATWDYQQYSVGYGSKASSSSQVVTPAEAEEMLKEHLTTFERSVNTFCKRIGKQPNQHQFDALVSFTYNLGTGWMSGSRLASWLRNPTTEMELVNAMGQWVRAGGKMLYALAQRRIREAIIFLKGEYSLPCNPTPASNYNIKSNLRVISNGALPYYTVVIYQYDYTTTAVTAGNGNVIAYYPIGGTYGALPVPTRDGYTFTGWKVTRINNNRTNIGPIVTASTAVTKNLELTAQWELGSTPSVDINVGSNNVTSGSNPSGNIPSESPGFTFEKDEYVEHSFSDVDVNDWFFEDVMYVYKNGLMNGVSEEKFGPDGNMTRGMLVTVLYRMDGSPKITEAQKDPFDDVSDEYYADAVAWGKANGIVTGITEDEFRPNSNVTREQAVAIFYRYCVNYCGLDSGKLGALDKFADENKVSDYAVEAMQWAVGEDLITGSTNDNILYLNPNSKLNRSQAAAMLRRCVEEILAQG